VILLDILEFIEFIVLQIFAKTNVMFFFKFVCDIKDKLNKNKAQTQEKSNIIYNFYYDLLDIFSKTKKK